MELVALIFSVLAFAIAAFSLIEVKAMQRSTHRIMMYDPTKQQFSDPVTEEQQAKMSEPIYDNF